MHVSRAADSRAAASGSELTQTRGSSPGRPVERAPGGSGYHGHWLGVGIASLPGSVEQARRYPEPATIANASSISLSTVGELTSVFNSTGSKALTRGAGGALVAGAMIGAGLAVHQVANDAGEYARNPQSEDAKWRLANSGLQTGVGIVALAATPFIPAAGLVPLFMPDIAQARQAVQLHGEEQTLQQNGLTTEAQAVHQQYVEAALNATPIVNWFESYYGERVRPAIEQFEASQRNFDGAPPKGELPPATRTDPRVADFYGSAMRERLDRMKQAQQGFLADLARREGRDSVTLVSRAPQVFNWPASGRPMRVFDRAVALTWSRATGCVSGTFFAPDADGIYRLPVLNEGTAYGPGKRSLVVISDQLDSSRQPVKFDLAAYRALPAGSVVFRDPNGYGLMG
ncbi:hypothetical protein GCM10027093_30090 [Paraburkholderia jirisanensis]